MAGHSRVQGFFDRIPAAFAAAEASAGDLRRADADEGGAEPGRGVWETPTQFRQAVRARRDYPF
jgi:hypothetical protein